MVKYARYAVIVLLMLIAGAVVTMPVTSFLRLPAEVSSAVMTLVSWLLSSIIGKNGD